MKRTRASHLTTVVPVHALSRLMLVGVLVGCRTRQPAVEHTGDDSVTPAAARSTPTAAPVAAGESGSGPVGSTADTAADDADSALAVLRGYYAALNARDFPRAYAAWADDGPPGRPTPAAFAAGYAATDSVVLTPRSPGRVEGAAGSRYVSIPVTLRAFERHGRRTRYTGSYTLRRSVVPGASAASRRWHLYRATLHARAAR